MAHSISAFTDTERRAFSPPARLQDALYTWLPIILVIGLAAWAGSNIWPNLKAITDKWPAAMGILAGTLTLSIMPLLICVVQTATKKRQLSKLQSVHGHPLAQTSYFQAAQTTVEASRAAGDIIDYLAPFLSFTTILLLGFGAIFFGYYNDAYFGAPSPILGGMQLPQNWSWAKPDAALAEYQRGTFAIITAAFIGSYVYALARLVERVNTNDLYPISLYYYGARTIIACFTAVVFRHTAESLYVAQQASLLILIGFATGLAPDNMIIALARRGFQQLKVWYGRGDPESEHRPTSLPLMMIDDITKEKVDRLNELGIDSAQMLACQNPFLLWTRAPFDLGLLTDWIAQAQLYALVRDETLEKLRRIYVNDIFDLQARLSSAPCSKKVCSALGIDETDGEAILQQLGEDQSFARLKEVQDALREKRRKTEVPVATGRRHLQEAHAASGD